MNDNEKTLKVLQTLTKHIEGIVIGSKSQREYAQLQFAEEIVKLLAIPDISIAEGKACLRTNCKQHTADDKCMKGDDYECLYRQT